VRGSVVDDDDDTDYRRLLEGYVSKYKFENKKVNMHILSIFVFSDHCYSSCCCL